MGESETRIEAALTASKVSLNIGLKILPPGENDRALTGERPHRMLFG